MSLDSSISYLLARCILWIYGTVISYRVVGSCKGPGVFGQEQNSYVLSMGPGGFGGKSKTITAIMSTVLKATTTNNTVFVYYACHVSNLTSREGILVTDFTGKLSIFTP